MWTPVLDKDNHDGTKIKRALNLHNAAFLIICIRRHADVLSQITNSVVLSEPRVACITLLRIIVLVLNKPSAFLSTYQMVRQNLIQDQCLLRGPDRCTGSFRDIHIVLYFCKTKFNANVLLMFLKANRCVYISMYFQSGEKGQGM